MKARRDVADGRLASYPGLTDYRHDPRIVGKMAAHIVLPWIHRVFALVKRWGLGTYHGLRRKHAILISTSSCSATTAASIVTLRSTVLGLTAHHAPASYCNIIGRANPRKGKRRPAERRDAERPRPEWVRTAGGGKMAPQITRLPCRRHQMWINLGQRNKLAPTSRPTRTRRLSSGSLTVRKSIRSNTSRTSTKSNTPSPSSAARRLCVR